MGFGTASWLPTATLRPTPVTARTDARACRGARGRRRSIARPARPRMMAAISTPAAVKMIQPVQCSWTPKSPAGVVEIRNAPKRGCPKQDRQHQRYPVAPEQQQEGDHQPAGKIGQHGRPHNGFILKHNNPLFKVNERRHKNSHCSQDANPHGPCPFLREEFLLNRRGHPAPVTSLAVACCFRQGWKPRKIRLVAGMKKSPHSRGVRGFFLQAPLTGLEPVTLRLTVECSAN